MPEMPELLDKGRVKDKIKTASNVPSCNWSQNRIDFFPSDAVNCQPSYLLMAVKRDDNE